MVNHMELLRDEGIKKWAVLGAVIATLEFVGDETLTSAFERAREHPVGKYVALGGLAVTGAHLLGVMPREIDPYYFVQDTIQRFRNGD